LFSRFLFSAKNYPKRRRSSVTPVSDLEGKSNLWFCKEICRKRRKKNREKWTCRNKPSRQNTPSHLVRIPYYELPVQIASYKHGLARKLITNQNSVFDKCNNDSMIRNGMHKNMTHDRMIRQSIAQKSRVGFSYDPEWNSTLDDLPQLVARTLCLPGL
jgi:hypothetical protein